MFIGGLIGFVLDNTIPGSDEERGLLKWKKATNVEGVNDSIYNIPIISDKINRYNDNYKYILNIQDKLA